MPKLRIAIVGGGPSSAAGRAHLSAISMDNRFELVAVVPSSRGVSHLSSNGSHWNHYEDCAVLENLESLLSKQLSLDLIVVLTPTPELFGTAMQVLQAGISVLIEKPGSVESRQLEAIGQLAKSRGRSAWVISNYSFFPAVRGLANNVDSIGEIFEIRAQMLQSGYVRKTGSEVPAPQSWRQQDCEIPMVSLDLGVHLLQLIYITTGRLPEVSWSRRDSVNNWKVVDSVDQIGLGSAGEKFHLCYGKRFLGHANSLSIEVFGKNGALSWTLESPDVFKKVGSDGLVAIVTRDLFEQHSSELMEYSRFKSGHSPGFVEALANNYLAVADEMAREKHSSVRPLSVAQSAEILRTFESTTWLG